MYQKLPTGTDSSNLSLFTYPMIVTEDYFKHTAHDLLLRSDQQIKYKEIEYKSASYGLQSVPKLKVTYIL